MTTYFLWKKTNKKYFLAILFSFILTPFSLFFDIVCPFMLIGNIFILGYAIFQSVNKKSTFKETITVFLDIDKGE